MPAKRSPNPAEQAGVFKKLEEVPSRYRFSTYASSYEGSEVWSEFLEAHRDFYADGSLQEGERTGRYWKEYMEGKDRHYALPTPNDVEEFLEWLTSSEGKDMNVLTVYTMYWPYLERFFNWLQFHTKHPHNYNPLLMAVIEYPDGLVGEVWDHKYMVRGNSRDESPDWRKDLQQSLKERNQ